MERKWDRRREIDGMKETRVSLTNKIVDAKNMMKAHSKIYLKRSLFALVLVP